MPLARAFKREQSAWLTLSGTSGSIAIPAWAKRFSVIVDGVSSNNTADIILRLSFGGVVATAGYLGSVISGSNARHSDGFRIDQAAAAAAVRQGEAYFDVLDDLVVVTGHITRSDVAGGAHFSGTIARSGTVDAIVITTPLGVDTFDAGRICVLSYDR